jgi:hypothetical protein
LQKLNTVGENFFVIIVAIRKVVSSTLQIGFYLVFLLPQVSAPQIDKDNTKAQ